MTRAWFAGMLDTYPGEPGCGAWYIVAGERLVGTCGYKEPPSPAGEVEIGYAVLTTEQRRGFASTAVELLVARAFRDPRVTAVVAETLPALRPSQAVLTRCVFVAAGGRIDPEDGEVVRFVRHRPALA